MAHVEIDDLRLKQVLTRELARLVESGEAPQPRELLRGVKPDWPGADVAAAPRQQLAPDQIYRSASRSVVAVGKLYLCSRCGKQHASFASGFVIAKSGLVVTNLHVVDDPEKQALGIMTLDGSVYPVQSIVCANRFSDLAVLEVPAEDLVPLPLGDEPPVGAPVYVLSHPAGRLFTFTAGIVSRYLSHGRRHAAAVRTGATTSPSRPGARLMAVTADFGRGSSGAPVLDAHGAVVGVARQTKPIYHHPGQGKAPRLQMVLKHCVPSQELIDLGFRKVG